MNSAKIILMAVGLLFTAMSVASCSRSPEQIVDVIASGKALSKIYLKKHWHNSILASVTHK